MVTPRAIVAFRGNAVIPPTLTAIPLGDCVWIVRVKMSARDLFS